MTTNAYAAKRAVFDALAQAARTRGTALDGRQVAYAWPGKDAELVCVYGGRVTFEQSNEDADLVDGSDRLVQETATTVIHICVAHAPPGPGGIRASDEECEAIGEAIGGLFARDRYLAGGHSVSRVSSGAGDYEPLDDRVRSTLTYRVTTVSYIEGAR